MRRGIGENRHHDVCDVVLSYCSDPSIASRSMNARCCRTRSGVSEPETMNKVPIARKAETLAARSP
jgi:hypothetical protein